MSRAKTPQQLSKALKEIKARQAKFKLKLDAKTIITLSDENKLKYWMNLYPNAKLI